MNLRESGWGVVGLSAVVSLLVGSGLAWWLNDDEPQAATAVESPIAVDAADLDAPVRPLPPTPTPAIVDPAVVVGYPTDGVATVPARAAIVLQPGDAGPKVVSAATGEDVAPEAPVVLPPVDARDITEMADRDEPVTTAAAAGQPEDTLPTGGGAFTDPCVDSGECTGEAAVVRAEPADTSTPELQPLLVGKPFPAAGSFADRCAVIEGDSAPDPLLPSGVRPTIAVLTNQPASVALTGTWEDASTLDKLTMLTSSDDDAAWQEAWDAGEQRQILSCITLPLELVRAHASAGRADLTVRLVGISAEGRTEIGGGLTLAVPLDGVEQPFVDSLVVTGMGERPRDDGTLAPAVQLHYAIDPTVAVPAGTTVDRSTASVQAVHAFVENADCAGWAVNQQGQDRTLDSTAKVRREKRVVDGVPVDALVVDSDLFLDSTVRPGWEGYACVRLFARDQYGNTATIAVVGAPVRAPRTATYDMGVEVLNGALPEGWTLEAAWADADGTVWCGPTTIEAGEGETSGAFCTTLARLEPHGVVVALTPIDPDGHRGQTQSITLPVNTAYCNSDDPYGWIGDGCDTGSDLTVQVTLDDETTVPVTLRSVRRAAPGEVIVNPSQGWRIDAVQSFRY